MTDPKARPDSEQLRAFEELMHYEGAAAFAAGPEPWEYWNGPNLGPAWSEHIEHPGPVKTPQVLQAAPSRPPGQRLLAGLTRLTVLVLAVGIAGVYLSSREPGPMLALGIQPPPIVTEVPATAETAAGAAGALPDFEDYPAPAAGLAERPAIEIIAIDSSPADTGQDTLVTAGSRLLAPPAPAELWTGQPQAAMEDSAWQPAPDTGALPSFSQATAVPGSSWQDAATDVDAWQPDGPETGSPATGAAGGNPQLDPPLPPGELLAINEPPMPAIEMPEPVPTREPVIERPAVTGAQHTVPDDGLLALNTPAGAAASPPPRAAIPAAPPAIATDSAPAWVVNLAAYNSETIARRMQEKFHDQGVETELVHITVNGKDMVRLRTTGHDSYRAALDWSELLEERLALSGTWVSKRR